MKDHEIRQIVRDQIIGAIEEDLENGESLMKEAYEQMETQKDLKVAYDEMRQIILAIQARVPAVPS